MSTIDIDKGYNHAMSAIDKIKRDNPHVKVGYLAKAGMHREAEGLTVASVGTAHEFGIGVPERSHIRSTHDENRGKWARITDRLILKILLKKISLDKSLDLMGQMIQKAIKNKIVNGRFVPNSPSTTARKLAKSKRGRGIVKPLIDTGQMLNSVAYEKVHKKFLEVRG